MKLPVNVGCRRPNLRAEGVGCPVYRPQRRRRHAEVENMAGPKLMLWTRLDTLLNLKGCEKRELELQQLIYPKLRAF